MNPENDFVVKSTYDETAYRAMAKATWKMFQKHRMEVMAYPALISVAIVIGFGTGRPALYGCARPELPLSFCSSR